eukprot:5356519-Amphidinium_carterae.1
MGWKRGLRSQAARERREQRGAVLRSIADTDLGRAVSTVKREDGEPAGRTGAEAPADGAGAAKRCKRERDALPGHGGSDASANDQDRAGGGRSIGADPSSGDQ